MYKHKLLWLFAVVICHAICIPRVVGQGKVVEPTGSVSGVVFDKSNNYTLEFATVSVYNTKDSLIRYLLTNDQGSFKLDRLPLQIPLVLKVSYIGYKRSSVSFSIPESEKNVDLKQVIMVKTENELEEVTIRGTPPPVSMKGDTLEFNADAFKMQPDAVVDDLLKALPGVIIWSDGLITVNGKKISKVLVDGKLFFGGSTEVITKNLPTGVVEKVQVYEDKKGDALHHATEMNVVLKKGAKNGLFGKTGAGYSNKKQFDINGMLSFYNPKTQLTLVGTLNNVNKRANSVYDLLNYSAYKSGLTSSSYTSDFSKTGLNKFSSTGYSLEHNISKTKALKSEYYLTNTNSRNLEESTTIFAAELNNDLKKEHVLDADNFVRNQNFKVGYNDENEKSRGYIDLSFNDSKSSGSNSMLDQSLGKDLNIVSNYRVNESNNLYQQNLGLRAGYIDRGRPGEKEGFRLYSVDYAFAYKKRNNDRNNYSVFTTTDTAQNRIFDRNYDDRDESFYNELSFVKRELLGVNFSRFFSIDFKNFINHYTIREKSLVLDDNVVGGSGFVNEALTNSSRYNTVDERLGLDLSKNFIKNMSGRYARNLNINIYPQFSFYSQNNASEKNYQNFDKGYINFTPMAKVSYKDERYGRFERNYALTYNTSIQYPGIYQLAPLIDNTNIYYQNFGNPNLRRSYEHSLSFSFKHTNLSDKNLFYNIDVKSGLINSYMADSSIYDAIGRNIHYTVNVPYRKYLTMSAGIYKALKINEQQVQINYSTSVKFSTNPSFINAVGIISDNTSTYNSLTLNYGFRGLELGMLGGFQTFKTVQKGTSRVVYEGSTFVTGLSAMVRWPKNFILSSNVDYKSNKSTGSGNINFAIWNAGINYRFLKKKDAEVMFTALDLLRQNKGVINYSSLNGITRGQVNVLQQYFMITLSYFPRKFAF